MYCTKNELLHLLLLMNVGMIVLTVDSITGEVFIADAKDYSSNGTLYAFDKTGKKEYSVTVGINPGKMALLKE